jgi:hypothetical protein
MLRIRQFALATACFAFVFVTPTAHAGSITLQTITSVAVASTNANGSGNQVALIGFSTAVSSPPGCAIFPQIMMAIDLSSNKGRAMLSTAQAAFLSGRRVSVSGQGNCFVPGSTSTTLYSGVETAHSITMVP